MRKALMVIVLAAIFTLALIQDSQKTMSQTLHVKSIDSVVSAQLVPAHAGAGGAIMSLDVKNANDKKVILKINNWLQAAKVIGDARGQSITIGGTPTELTIKFNTGDVIGIIMQSAL